MKRRWSLVVGRWPVALALLVTATVAFGADTPKARVTAPKNEVLLPGHSPLVSFRILFTTGAAFDPPGKEGLAALTASMIAHAGSRTMPYSDIQAAFYPMAAFFERQTDKEMTVFYGTSHIDNLERYYGIVRGMLLEPGFRAEDFERVKTDQLNALKVNLRASNDEELGKEVLYTMIYGPEHPYGHTNPGRVSALEKLTLADVKEFYAKHYTQANLVIGLAGGYPAGFDKRVATDLAKLPAGQKDQVAAKVQVRPGTEIEIVQRETRSTAISLGFPIDVNRAHKDWAALAVVASYFGQHRSSNSYLYQRIRAARGLNYGDYAYVEHFPFGMFRFEPPANVARSSQVFQIWIRPVEPPTAHFTLRAALYEYDKLVRDGMSPEAFAATREFLSKYVNVMTATQDAQLGYALDSRYYGIPEFTNYVRQQLAKLTVEDVNRAIKQYLNPGAMKIAIVTKDADALRQAIVSNASSPVTYTSPKPPEILEEDKTIQEFPIKVAAENVKVVPVDSVFQ